MYRDTLENYDRAYEGRLSSPFPPFHVLAAWKRLLRIIDFRELFNLAPGSRVLDVGCGPGYDSFCWFMLGMDVTGIDLSTTAIDEAKARWLRDDPAKRRLRFVHADALEYDYPQGHYDLIYCKAFDVTNTDDIFGAAPNRLGKALLGALKPDGLWHWELWGDGGGNWSAKPKIFNHSVETIHQYFSQFPCFVGEICHAWSAMRALVCHNPETFRRVVGKRTGYRRSLAAGMIWVGMLPLFAGQFAFQCFDRRKRLTPP